MKALAYEKAHSLDAFAIELIDASEPRLRDTDLLVGIRAVGINPGETLIRQTRSAEPGGRIILRWEFAGVVEAVGPQATGFAVGDRVMGTGDITRDGAWAERLTVDHRVVVKIPDQLSFSDAASLPIGGLTAWEGTVPRSRLLAGRNRPGADHRRRRRRGDAGDTAAEEQDFSPGGEHSLASRIPRVVHEDGSGCGPRPHRNVPGQLRDAGIDRIDLVLSTSGTTGNLGWITQTLRPFGHLAVIDLNGPLNLEPLVGKSVSLHTETVFSKIMAGGDIASQGRILAELAADVVAGRLRPIATTILDGLSVNTMRAAHELAESRRTIGKTVINI